MPTDRPEPFETTPTLIEWGWLVAAPLAPGARRALDAGRERVLGALCEHLPRFEWRLPLIEARGAPAGESDEPIVRLREGAHERETRGWDFALVVTPADLRTYYKSFALAVPSQALAVALLSLARLDDRASEDALADRIAALALHLLGDLNGLWHRDEPDAVMRPPETPADLDASRELSPQELERLGAALDEVADLRLEEEADAPRFAPWFYLRASWTQAPEIALAILQSHFWELPLRLSRLTTAALSALFVLMLTAEVWDLGTSQPAARVAGLSAAVIAATTGFVLWRQKLLLRRTRHTLSERVVAANVAAFWIVLLGLVTTYALLFALTTAAAWSLFGPELIARWAPAVGAAPEARDVAVLAGLVSSLGLVFGSLGASFEVNHYFQHVIYADEET